jgi:hypothetical protein
VLEPVYRAVSNTAVRKDMWVRIPPAAPFPELLEFDCRAMPPELDLCADRQGMREAYAYLLGMYLGDGMLTLAPRRVWRLRVVLDIKYPHIIDRCAWAMAQVSGRVTGRAPKLGCVELYSNWKHWHCLFPQHGAGPKHKRRIVLEPFQEDVRRSYPHEVLRGLIHSDGCRATNRVRRPTQSGPKVYEYPRYFFSNASADIRAIFASTCDQVGVRWRRTNERNISVARRESVEILDSFVGPKR